MMHAAARILALLIIAGTWAGWEVLDRMTPAVASPAPFSATQGGWAVDLLARLGNDAPTAATVAHLEAWHRAEGGTATFNWLNTTQGADGATEYNSVGVKNYPDYATGIEATAETLTNGRYPLTLAGLVNNQPVVDDSEMATWGTGGGAIRRQLEETQARKCLPTGTGAISAHFDSTGSPFWAGQAGGMHNGTDFSGNPGDPVYAPFDLTVEDIQYYGDAGRIGWYVQGRFTDGYLFYAGHLGTVAVSVGQAVPACTPIGTIGEVFHSHIKIASPDKPSPCEATGCDDFERYFEEH